jgi:predicted enzyme related to lactoylglutathione lyase
MEPKHAINFFEIPVNDFNRARQFYSRIFNYEMPERQMGPNRRGFLLSSETLGSIGGAIVQGPDYIPSQRGSLLYLNAGDDLSLVLNRVEAAGGQIELEKAPVAELEQLGYFAVIRDTEGNRIALHSMA